MAKYWYNVQTHEVEKDAQSGWQSLIGPYESRAEAEQALAKLRERNELADAQDEEEGDA